MQQDFEKTVHDKLHDYFIEPSGQVWNNVSASLKTPKKRRVIGGWLFAAAIIFVAAGTWFAADIFFTKDKNGTSIAKNNTSVKPNDIKAFIKNLSKNADINSLNKQSIINLQKSVAANLKNEEKSFHNNDLNTSNPEKNIPLINSKNSLTVLNNPSEKKNILNDDFKDELLQNTTQENVAAKNTAAKILTFNTATALQNDAIKNIQQPSKNIIQNKKTARSVWSFLFDGGTTNTTSSDFLFRKKSEDVYRDSRGINDTAKKMRGAYTGFHVTAGIQYSLALKTRWTFYTGLQYSFLLNHQRTGQKIVQESEIATSSDTSLAASHGFTKIQYHYLDGTSAVNTNHASWLEMPVGIGYKLNPSAKKIKLEVRTGASFAHMFANKWLIADGRYNKFYYSNTLTNDMILNWHGDLVVTLPKNKIIGLQVQHSFTSFAKQSVQPSLYWSNISIYTTIPLKK